MLLGRRFCASHHLGEIGVDRGPESDLEHEEEDEILLDRVDDPVLAAHAVNPEDGRVLVVAVELLVTGGLRVLREAVDDSCNFKLLFAGKPS